MIVLGAGVAGTLADNGRASLDKEVNQLRNKGMLDARERKRTLELLKWTPETLDPAKEFENVSFV